jgi:hypothetical protein
MSRLALSLRLREKLGHQAADELVAVIEATKDDMLIASQERFETRLTSECAGIRQELTRVDGGLRMALAEGLAKIRTEIAEARVEVLRWAFLFWVGQVAATAAIVAMLARFITGR